MNIKNGKWLCPICDTENSCADKSKSCPACGYQLTSTEIEQVEANSKIIPKKKSFSTPKPRVVKSISETYTPKKVSNNDFKESIYIQACSILNSAETENDYKAAENQFSRIKYYRQHRTTCQRSKKVI